MMQLKITRGIRRNLAISFLYRGFRGPKMINNTVLHTPKPDPAITSARRKGHQRRAAIEPVIGHLKKDYRMLRNYLKGICGDAINLMLAAAAMNFKRMMNKWKTQFSFLFHQYLHRFCTFIILSRATITF